MSQAGFFDDTTLGGDIETITGDVGGAVGPNAAHNLNLLTDNFLTTTGNAGTNTITISLDGATMGTGQTIGAVTADLITLNLGAVATTWIIEAKIAGFNAATPAGCGYNLLCGARTTGAAATIVGVQDQYVAEDAALVASDVSFIAVGNTVIVRATGVAGLTINWRATTKALGV